LAASTSTPSYSYGSTARQCYDRSMANGEEIGHSAFDDDANRMLDFEDMRTKMAVIWEARRVKSPGLAAFSAIRAEEHTEDTFLGFEQGASYADHPSAGRLRRAYNAFIFFFTNPDDFEDEPAEEEICYLLALLVGNRPADETDMTVLIDDFEKMTSGLIVHSLVLEEQGLLEGLTYRERLPLVNNDILSGKPLLDCRFL